MKLPQNNIFALSVISALVIFICFRECGRSEPQPQEPIKQRVATLKHNKAVSDTVVKYLTSVRVKHVHHWHEVRRDSLIPCEEKLLICDTLILADSALIDQYRQLAQVDSMIIKNLDKVVQMDSAQIVGLKKEVRKQKRLKWLFFAGGVAANIIR